MFDIPGYSITHTLHEGANSIIYHGVRTDNNQPILLKILCADYPTPQQISQFNREYEFTKDLNIPGIRHAIEIITIDNKPALILEYVDGLTLNEAFVGQQPSFSDFLKAAIQIAQILSDLHHHRIIHKDINPGNILFDPQHETVTIIDFGMASKLNLKMPHLGNPDQLEGTLPYISPEQSGRMNRTVDFRSDLYSLGATLYTCVVGRPPFEFDDPLALIHAHIAKSPPPMIDQIEPASPLFVLSHAVLHALSDVIMKLLSKKAEDRYQSALGLRRDLEQIAAMLDNPDMVFQLGRDDVSEQLLMPETLYGREHEINLLLGTFENLSAGGFAALTLVSGAAGVGKSALVSELHPPMTARQSYFIQGKFDQYQRNVPYSALSQALNQLCRFLLTEHETTLNAWRDTILQVVGQNGQVLIDLIPDLELVIGPQSPVPALGPQETHNRFALYLQGFMQAISQSGHPLVMFLDDLHWADMASLQALKTLFQAPDLTHLLIIGAYRDNEVSPGHPLLITVEEITAAGIPVNAITLHPLGQEHVAHWIADTLKHDVTIVQPLTDLVYEKTLGNPFFVRQFLQSLYEEGLLWCERRADEDRPNWHWDLERIQRQAMTENVVTLMVTNISKQPAAMQRTLQIAACIGNRFDVQTLAWAMEESPQATYQRIVQGIAAGFLAPLDEQSTIVAAEDAKPYSVFRFVHDRIQQAAASMLSPAEQEQAHLDIGRLLLTHTPADEQEKAIFALVTHLNQGRRLISDAAERLRLIELNLLAGKRAKQATAYQEAFEYLQIGMEMLPDTAWHIQYQLTYSLHTELISCAYLTGQFDLVDTLVQSALQHARTDVEYAAVQVIQIVALIAQAHHEEAIEIGVQALARLGVTFPKNPTEFHLFLSMLRTRYYLWGKSMSDLFNRPPIQDEKLAMAFNIISQTGPSLIFSHPVLFVLAMQRGLVLSVQHGYSGQSGLLYLGHGMFVAGKLHKYEQGVRLGELGLRITEHYRDPVSYAQGHFTYSMLGHWRFPLFDLQPKLLETYRLGRAVGETGVAAFALLEYLMHAIYSGSPLPELAELADAFDKQMASMNQEGFLAYLHILAQFIRNLMEHTAEPHRLTGELVDGETLRAHFERMQDKAGLLHIHCWQTILGYHFGHYDLALQDCIQARRYADTFMAAMEVSVLSFYETLIRLEIAPAASGKDRFVHQWAIRKYRKLLRRCADVSPVNYAHKYELVQAEWYRFRRKPGKAHACYQRAVALAKKHGFQWDLALGYELAGRFYQKQEQTELAHTCLRQAHQAYHAWGAAAKVRDLETRYSSIIRRSESEGTTISTTSHVLDWHSVIKAAQTLSGEINLEHLLTQLMQTVLENAGAEHGYLFLPKDQTWALEAEGHVESAETTVLQSIPLEHTKRVSVDIIHYVARTQEDVVLHDAANDGRFTHDAYIVKYRPTSVLCLPLVNQGEVTGILYLENNMTTGAFTPDRLEVLRLLASQAAISIENARLYDQLAQYSKTLEANVAERTTELTTANVQLSREIAERKRTEEALQHAKEAADEARNAAESANQAKSVFLANMSHELRTPLNSILGYTQILKRDKSVTKPQQDAIETIHHSSEHLLTLINDLLDLSRIEAQKMELEPVDVYLPGFLKGISEIARIRAQQKGVPFECDIASDVPPGVHADEKRLRQVLLNLLNNAIKFTEEGKVTLKVTKVPKVPKVEEDDLKSQISNLKFKISDTGIGIAPDQLEEIFLPFHQVHAPQLPTEGTGLGLSISRNLVRIMGSELHVKSVVGQGTTFWFDLELPEVEGVGASEAVSVARQARHVIGLKGAPRKILLVDDDDDNRAVLHDMLLPLGFEMAEAVNGQDALAKAAQFLPELILMDLMMPVMDGLEATRQIRQIPALKGVIVIAISASPFYKNRQVNLNAGCDDFLVKPIQIDDLLDRLQRHLRLEWLYEEPLVTDAGEQQASETLPFVTPPKEELETILKFAEISHITGIQQSLEHIKRMDKAFIPFVSRIEELLESFQFIDIIAMIQCYLEGGER